MKKGIRKGRGKGIIKKILIAVMLISMVMPNGKLFTQEVHAASEEAPIVKITIIPEVLGNNDARVDFNEDGFVNGSDLSVVKNNFDMKKIIKGGV